MLHVVHSAEAKAPTFEWKNIETACHYVAMQTDENTPMTR